MLPLSRTLQKLSRTAGGKRIKIFIQIDKIWITEDLFACHQRQVSIFFNLSLPKITWKRQEDRQHFDPCDYHKLVDSQPSVERDVDGASIECQLKCRWIVDRILIECWSVSINTQPQVPVARSPVCIAQNKKHDYNYHVPARVKNTASYFLPRQ